VGFQARRILHLEVRGKAGPDVAEELGALRRVRYEFGKLGTICDEVIPSGFEQRMRRALVTPGGRNVKEPFENQVHQGAQRGGALGRFRHPVDDAEPVHVRALREVVGARRGQARCSRHGSSVGPESDTS